MLDNENLRTAIQQLAHDDRFKLFIAAIGELKEQALGDALTTMAVGSDRQTLTALGEIRALRDIEGLYFEAVRTRVEEERGE